MIKAELKRTDVYGYDKGTIKKDMGLQEALHFIFWVDFLYGGKVTDIDFQEDTCTITTTSSVFGDTDINHFTGSVEYMRPLLQILRSWLINTENHQIDLDSLLDRLPPDLPPNFGMFFMNKLVGETKLKHFFLSVLGLNKELLKLGSEDFCAFLGLILEGYSKEEAMELYD